MLLPKNRLNSGYWARRPRESPCHSDGRDTRPLRSRKVFFRLCRQKRFRGPRQTIPLVRNQANLRPISRLLKMLPDVLRSAKLRTSIGKGVRFATCKVEVRTSVGQLKPARRSLTTTNAIARRGGRVADCTGLENRHVREGIVGSNPTLSAQGTFYKQRRTSPF